MTLGVVFSSDIFEEAHTFELIVKKVDEVGALSHSLALDLQRDLGFTEFRYSALEIATTAICTARFRANIKPVWPQELEFLTSIKQSTV